jgi:hypothetical protein
MATETTVKITGMEDLEKKLLAIGQDFAAKSLVSAAMTANKPLEDNIRTMIAANDSIDTGTLYSSIARKRKVYDKSGTIVVITGVSTGVIGYDAKGNVRIPAKYAHLVEKHKSFMKTAYDVTKETVVEKFVESLRRKIDRYNKTTPAQTTNQ